MPAKDFGKSLKKQWKNLFEDRGAASPAPFLTQSTDVQSFEQGDAEYGPKASASNVSEPPTPPNPSVADARATRPSTSAGPKEGGPPVTASTLEKIPKSPSSGAAQMQVQLVEPGAKDTQLATESTEQQTSALTSQRLWNAAYDSLEKDKDTAELVRSYVKTLTTVLGTAPRIASSTDVLAELNDPSKRQTFMKELVEKGQAKISTPSKITKGVGDVAQFILSAKGMIAAMQSIPQAALPLAGVCVGLQILLNPTKATKSNLAGIAHVVSRMDWYCALTEHLLKKDHIDESFESILPQLEAKVAALYKALLLYQMKSVCSYYRHQGLVFLRGLTNWDDWDADLKTVTDAEETLQADSDQCNKLHAKSALGRLAELGEERRSLLGDIHQTLQDFIALQKEMHLDDTDRQCRWDLRVVNPKDDMKKIENKKDKLLDRAYKWILDTEQYAAFTRWSDNQLDPDPCRLLWIKGRAGTGKTMLLVGIIRELENKLDFLAPSLSYFFCQGTDTTLNNATATLRSLVWMLLVEQPHLISHLRKKYKDSGPDLFRDRNAFFALSEAFQSMLKDPRLSPVYFVVDALDECDPTKPGLEELIQLISTSLSLSDKVKWLVSSRPEVDVLAELETLGSDNPDISQTLVELDAQSLADPVNAYVNHKLNTLKGRKGYDNSVLADVSNEVRRRAMNTFLWVALAFKVLETVHGRYAVKRIKEMPPGLSELYDHMMTRIENEKMIDPQDSKRILVATSLAYCPLSLCELAILADLPPDITETAVEICGSFLTVSENTVNLIHQSAKSYLDENYKSRLQPAGVAQGHADFSRRSLDAMSSILKQNMYDLHFGFKSRDMRPLNPDSLAPIRYSCVFWADHLFLNGESPECKRELTDDGAVFGFLKERFLRWLESLSLLGKLSDGILSIRRLLHVVQVSGVSPRLAGFLKDAEKFVLSHGSIIERAPLQTYGTALVFSPMTSEVKNAQWKERLSFIKTVAGIRDRWGAHQQTLEGHSGYVNAVAFSPNGKTLASASNDGTVRLWDAATGAHQQTLEGHGDFVNAVAFSPGGKILASTSNDRTARLWDAATGAHKQTLHGHSNYVRAVAFSPDGKILASASADGTVRLWDATTGAYMRILDGYGGYVNSVAFSLDGKILASASADGTVRLWDATTGAYKPILDGHSSCVNSVAFSPDGRIFASASDDRTVRLWDASSGAHIQTLDGHGGFVRSIAFSPDGKILALASGDQTIQLWDASSGAHIQTLDGHGGFVRSIAFSPDGKILASASGDKTARLWDASTSAYQQTLDTRSCWVRAVAFSPDGNILASASGDGKVRLWDAASGAHKQTLDGHSGWVNSVAFSPDSGIIASASSDGTGCLWDASTGTHKQTLDGHSGWVNSVTFSPDGKILASASGDQTIRLWDAATGAHTKTLEGHSDWVNSVAFSPDGRTLASASDDRTVRFWDASTGTHIQTLGGHSGYVRAVAFSPDGKILVSVSGDKTLRLWDASTGIYIQTLGGHRGYVRAVAFSPDGNILASASGDGTVRLWDAGTGANKQTLEGHGDWVNSVAFSPNGKTLASASDDRTVRLWDANTGTHKQTLNGHGNYVRAVAFSPGGKILVSVSGDKTVRLWDAGTGIHKQTLDGHRGWVNSIAFSPDGKVLASASGDQTVQLWDASSGAHIQTLDGHGGFVRSIVFSPDGKILASASGDQTVRLWDVSTGTHKQTLKGHGGWVNSVAFSPDGKILASASGDKTARLWDTGTGAHKQILNGHSGYVRAVAFSPDGKILASASDDWTVRLWDVASGAHKQTLEGHYNWVNSVAFSPDGRILASASGDKTVRLWDAVTGSHKQTLKVNISLETLSFSEDSRYLNTDRGLLSLSSSLSGAHLDRRQSISTVFVDKDWVTRDGRDIIWLPPDYRATCAAFCNNVLVLGHESGQVTFFEFASC